MSIDKYETNVRQHLLSGCIGVDRSLQCKPGHEVIKLFACSTQLSMKFVLLINVKMPTIVGILIFMNRKNSIISLSEHKKC